MSDYVLGIGDAGTDTPLALTGSTINLGAAASIALTVGEGVTAGTGAISLATPNEVGLTRSPPALQALGGAVVVGGQIIVPSAGDVTADFYSIFDGSTWTDNGKWTNSGGIGHNTFLQVFDTGVDADVPGGRGCRIIGTDEVGHDFWNAVIPAAGSRAPTPAVGETVSWRNYVKFVPGLGAQDDGYHPLGFGSNGLNSGPIWLVYNYVWQPSGLANWQIQVDAAGHAGSAQWTVQAGYEGLSGGFGSQELPEGTWYRVEHNFTRTATSTWTGALRWYNPAGTLLFDHTDLYEAFGSGGIDLFGTTFTNTVPVRSVQIEWGSPGVSPGPLISGTFEAERYAAFACIVDSVAHTNMPYGYFAHET